MDQQWQKPGGCTCWVGDVVRAVGFTQWNGDVWLGSSERRDTAVPDRLGIDGPVCNCKCQRQFIALSHSASNALGGPSTTETDVSSAVDPKLAMLRSGSRRSLLWLRLATCTVFLVWVAHVVGRPLCVRRPLWVNQRGQLSLPSLRGR